jgi:hypothetical protein
MASFLDMDNNGRKIYVARQLGANPDDQANWPHDIIDAIINEAEKSADQTVWRRVRELNGVCR